MRCFRLLFMSWNSFHRDCRPRFALKGFPPRPVLSRALASASITLIRRSTLAWISTSTPAATGSRIPKFLRTSHSG